MGSLDYKTMAELAHSIRDANHKEPADMIRDYAERHHLNPLDTLVVTFEKSKTTELGDTRSTIHWSVERKATVGKALGQDFAKVIRHYESLGHEVTRVEHPDRYSRDLDKWTREPSKDMEPTRDLRTRNRAED